MTLYFAPRVIRETSQGIEHLPIDELMLQRREIWLNREIDSNLADGVIQQICIWRRSSPGRKSPCTSTAPAAPSARALPSTT